MNEHAERENLKNGKSAENQVPDPQPIPEATVMWRNDLLWSWINTQLARKEAKRLGKEPIHYACIVVPIPSGDPRRNLPPEDVLRQMGHEDIIARLRDVWGCKR